MPFTILVPTSVPLALDLPDGVVAVDYAPDAPIPAEHTGADALVVWGNPADLIADAARRRASAPSAPA